MAWSYADWITQSTTAAKKTRLELHIAEVGAEIGPDSVAGGQTRQHAAAVTYYQQLLKAYADLIADAPTQISADSPRARSGFTRGRPITR